MKTILTIILSLLLSYSFSQVALTPQGLRSASDLDKDFIILNFDLNQDDLFKTALTAVNKLYVSPKRTIDKVENSSIKISANSGIISTHKLTIVEKQKYSIDYVINIDFKDGKARIRIPQLNFKQESLSGYDFFLVADKKLVGRKNGIWNYKNDLINGWLKEDVESFFDDWINSFRKSIEDSSSW